MHLWQAKKECHNIRSIPTIFVRGPEPTLSGSIGHPPYHELNTRITRLHPPKIFSGDKVSHHCWRPTLIPPAAHTRGFPYRDVTEVNFPSSLLTDINLTGIQVRLHVCNHFQTSFVLELVALSCFGLKLLMMVIMKALFSLYNIEPSTIHEARNAKELCLFANGDCRISTFFKSFYATAR